MSSPIDRFIPQPDVVERREIEVAAPADVVFAVACEMDLRSIPLVAAIFWLRERLLRATPRARLARGIVAETTALGWGRLHEQPGRLLVMGAATQPWQADVVFRAVPPETFAAFAEPDCVKIAWTLEAEPLENGHTRHVTETRVVATDDGARRRFRRYWLFFGVGIKLIRRLAVRAVKREAERRVRTDRRWPRPAVAARPPALR